LLFSLGSGQLFYYALSFFNPTLVESLLNQKTFLSSSETVAPLFHNLLILFTVFIVAPVTEEFIFRGVLLHRWTAKWGITPALLISALLFGLLHANIIGLFVFGLMMALLYLKTRTLIVPIICHALNNLVAVGLELASQNSGTTERIDVLTELRTYWWVGLVYIVLSAPWLITFIYNNWPKQSFCLPYFTNSEQ
jgi:membrane protease YdiL (CAAX protease family)